jgi:hypothetical protein
MHRSVEFGDLARFSGVWCSEFKIALLVVTFLFLHFPGFEALIAADVIDEPAATNDD